MPHIQFDNATDRRFDAAVKSGSDRAARLSAWYATLAGTFNRPALYLIDSAGAEVVIQLTGVWERVGNAARIPAHTAQATATAAVTRASIVRAELRQGTAVMTIDLSVLTVSLPEGQTAFSAGPSQVRIGPINIDMSDWVIIVMPTNPTTPTNGVPQAIIDLPASAPVSKWTTADGQGLSGVSWETDPATGDMRSAVRAGDYIGLNDCWQVGGGRYNLEFVRDWGAAISGTQFKQRVGVGPMSSGRTVSAKIQARLPSKSVVQANKGSAQSEITGFPNITVGARIGGWGAGYPASTSPNFPCRYGDIRSLWIGAKSWGRSGEAPGWVALDMRALNTGSRPTDNPALVAAIDAEFLITRAHYPSTYNTADDSTSGRMVWSGTLGGVFFKVFFQYGAAYSGVFLPQFRAVNGAPNDLNIKPLVDWLLTRRYSEFSWTGNRARGQGYNDTIFSPNMWLHMITTGFEVEYGSLDIDIDGFYCRLNQD